MRVARIALALPGLAALGYGVLLAVRFAAHSFTDGRSALAYLIGSPVLHDALVAPVVGLVGLLISRWVGRYWRAPVRIGLAASATLVLIAVPGIWRTDAGQHNPGLDDRNYALGLGIALVVVWAGVGAGGWLRRHPPRMPRKLPKKTVSSSTPAGRSGSP